ncbi:hypothetical protein ACTA71_002315 [Dictyostelium dimigraforme]
MYQFIVLFVLFTIIFYFVMGLFTPTKDIEYDKYDLKGKVVIITGSNAGLGKEVAKKIGKLGAHIIFACRNEVKAKEAIKEVFEFSNGENDKLEFMKLDLLSLGSIREFANQFQNVKKLKCDILINNAGIMWLWEDKKWNNPITKNGGNQFNTQFLANYLGHFLLTQLLLKNLMENQARILNISSSVHSFGGFSMENLINDTSYTFQTYCQSKLAQIYSTYYLDTLINCSENENGNKATINAIHPGIFASEIVNLPFPLNRLYHTVFKSAEYCARGIVKCAIDNQFQSISGKYIDDTKIINSSSLSYNKEIGKQLYNHSIDLVKDYLN